MSSQSENKIYGKIRVPDDYIDTPTPIINSYERCGTILETDDDEENCQNDDEIKENITIKIEGKPIDFSYTYKFDKEGIYEIEYSFKGNLTKTNYMFAKCDLIEELDLSNFKTQNVSNMCSMFSECRSLKKINLANIDTANVADMNAMFYDCESLKELNLQSFNTQNVNNMSKMFYRCYSLDNLNFLKCF